MRKLVAFAAVLAVCAGPTLAQAGRPGGGCDLDPDTTGVLQGDPRSLSLPGERPDAVSGKVEMMPPEDGWQEDAEETSEQRQREALACGSD